jgi:hypothetical protein
VPFKRKIGGRGNRSERLWSQAGVNLHDAATLNTGEMVMVTPFRRCAADAIAMRSIAELDAV